jgi:polysaccharide pyruvyl transferase CsaB
MNPIMVTLNDIPSQHTQSKVPDFSGLKLVVSGYYGFDNLGDELILQTLIQYARSRGCKITVLSKNPQKTTEQYGVPAIQRTNLSDIVKCFAQSHLFISGGGGLFQDTTGPASPIYYGGLILLADYLRLPVIVWGQGVGPLNHPFSKMMTRWAFSKARQIIVRDEKSDHLVQDLLKENASKVPVNVTADPVWLWQADTLQNQTQPIPEGIRVGVSLRTWPTLSDRGIEALAKALIHWIQQAQTQAPDLPVEILFMPFQEEQDVPALKQLEKTLNNLSEKTQTPVQLSWVSPQSLVQVLPSLNFMIAMRFHALLLGLTQSQFPIFAIAYDPKVKALANKCGVQHTLPEELNELPPNAFEKCFSGFFEQTAHGLYPTVAHQKTKAQANTESLDALLLAIRTTLLTNSEC